MAIPALDITIGGASANSYIEIEDADNYHDSRLSASAWFDASPDDRKRGLLMSAQRLDRENWLGGRVARTQRLAWPRIGVTKVDSVGACYAGFGWGWGGFGEQYSSTEIPQPVKDAQCELALAYLQGFDDGAEEAIDSFSEDGVSVKLRQSKPHGGLPPRVMQLIGGLIAGNQLIRG
jgi:hypothetical protein